MRILSTQLLYDVEKSRCLDLEADMSKVHDESKLISKLEREYLNLQLKYQHLQESFGNKKSQASQEAPDFNSFFKIKNLEHQIQEKDNVIRHLKDLVADVNDRSSEPYNAIDVTALIEQNDCDRVKLLLRSPCMRTHSQARRLRQQYRQPQQVPPHLVETPKDTMADNRTMAELFQALTEGYEDASQELKKQVTFNDKPGTSSSNTQKHEVHQKVQQTNIHVIPSTGVNTSTEASGSKPRSNTKKNRILPAKSENKKKSRNQP
ncbi:hypothetical protein Tco_1190844 [Tanacetum coccineum]